MDNSSEKIKKRYNRVARVYDILEKPMELMALSKWRKDVMVNLKGKILEIGVGTGKNIEYYPADKDITAIDFSEKMLQKANQKALQYNNNVKLIQMDAEDMSFPDNTFDVVFTTCVFCSVPNPIKGLKEIMRVCKPNGTIIMIEHVRSEKKFLGLLMDILNPLVLNTYGANINRRTVDNIYKAGYVKVVVEDLKGDIVKKIVIENDK